MVYIGLYSDVDNIFTQAAYVLAHIGAWITIVLTLGAGFFLFDEMVIAINNDEAWRPSRTVDTIYDMGIVAAFAFAGSYVTAVLYIAPIVVLYNVHSVVKSKSK